MGKATLKGLLAHKLRLAATALAIVLGVSFVAGTYVLTDTITASFDNLFKQVTQGIDVAVRSKETFGGFDTGEVRDPMPASLLERVRAVDGVRVAEGSVTGYAQLVGKNGKAVTTSGAPSLGVSFNQDSAFTAGSTVRSGRLPTGPDDVAIDAKTAEDTGYTVGDRVKLRLVNEMDSDHPMHHPFHLHGAGRFLVLSRDGVPEPNLVWKDTVLVRTGQTVDILFDVSNPGLWMAHCHIAEHMQSGMMFSFNVARDQAVAT